MDYGILCLSFVFYGMLPLFLIIYTFIFAATAGFLVLASVKWFRELSTVQPASNPAGKHRLQEPAAATGTAATSGTVGSGVPQ